ncbi:MAG: hypothetical protein ACP5NZ_04310 [Nanobdellota archaeon]
MKTTNKKTNGMALLATLLVFTLSLVSFAGFASASLSLVYNNSEQYAPTTQTSHNYDIPDNYVSYATIKTRGTAGNQCAYVLFNYDNGLSANTSCENVLYLSWKQHTLVNPNPTTKVVSITFKGGSNTYYKDFFVYGSSNSEDLPPYEGGDGGYNGGNGETYCGNNIKDGEEECDKGTQNGVVCSAGYGSSCTYCSNSCETKTVSGGFCGDGALNEGYEKCDDGNNYDGDKCTSECKKPFEVTVEDFEPIVWQCDHRVVYDDGTEPGRISENGKELCERMNDYAFEGEQIQWKVLVMDKNGIEKVKDVYVTVDGEMEANCDRLDDFYFPNDNIGETAQIINTNVIDPSCNARILEERITTFNPETMVYYLCTLTIETPESMYGEVDIEVEAEDLDGIIGTVDETEHWFLNPFIELAIDGEIEFDEVRPGTTSYSQRILVGNDADDGSGVLLDMFISGTDFYDSSSSGAKCPTTNQLELENFAYYASSGAYSTHNDGRSDAEGYVPIEYGIGFNDPKPFYDTNEIMQVNKDGKYYRSNVLTPGSEMTLIFRLELPEPCNGDFTTGQIYFWGEAI